jgi:hypothetical protein
VTQGALSPVLFKGNFKMTATTKTETATLARDAAVVKCLIAANRAGKTLLDQTREAAKLAALQLDQGLPLKERIAAVMSAYSPELGQNINVRSLFSDTLTLLACAQAPVSVKVHAAGAKPVDEHTTAEKAVDMPKHAIRDAAKQVREQVGLGRKAGGGAKPKTAKAIVNAANAEAAPDMLHIDAFSNWLDMLPEYLQDSVYHGKVVAALIAEGYTLTKAAKGKVIKGAASA